MKTGVIGLSAEYGRYNQTFSGAKFFLQEGRKITQNELDYEASQAKRARDGGVCVPKYKIKENELHIDHIRYETKGDAANIETNPLRYKHLRSLFKNLYFMDRAGIFHKNLGPEHIFLQDDGQVEFDCFRDSVNFYQRYDGTISQSRNDINVPDFMLPSNEEAFRRGYLSKHIGAFKDIADKNYFMKNYLSYASDYHQRRAELLAKRGLYKGIEYETTLRDIYERPSRRVLSFEIEKLTIEGQTADILNAFSEKGKNLDPKDPDARFDSVLAQLNNIENIMNLKDAAEHFSENSMNQDERKYFKFEEAKVQKMLDVAFSDMENAGALTFFDPENKIALGYGDEMEFFLELCGEVDFASPYKARCAIKDIREYYTALKDRWDKDLNKDFLEERLGL